MVSLKTKKGCLPKGTYIKTAQGFTDITDIKIGDEIFTYTENGLAIQKVRRVIGSGEKQLFELKTRNRSIRASGNHPFLVVHYKGKQRFSGYNTINKHPYSYNKNKYELVWKPLAELKKGDIIVVYSGGVGLETENTDINPNLMKLLGCFLGDGSNTVRKNRPHGGRIYFHLHNKDLIAKYSSLLDSEGISHTKNDKRITICRNEDYYKLTELGLCRDAHNKIIPDWVFSLPKQHKDALLEGLIDSDGYKIQFGYGINLCNKRLVEQIRNLCIDLGYRVGNIREKKATKGGYIKGRAIIGGDTYILYFYTDFLKNNSRVRFNRSNRISYLLPEGFQYQTIHSITKLNVEPTYNIEVEKTNNFIADGVVVHNSNEPMETSSGKIGCALNSG